MDPLTVLVIGALAFIAGWAIGRAWTIRIPIKILHQYDAKPFAGGFTWELKTTAYVPKDEED